MLWLLYCMGIAITWGYLAVYAIKKHVDCNLKIAIGVTLISVAWPLSLSVYLLFCALVAIDELVKK